MAGPWEDYKDAGPWVDYQQAEATEAPSATFTKQAVEPKGVLDYGKIPITQNIASDVKQYLTESREQPSALEIGKKTALPMGLSIAGGIAGGAVGGPAGAVAGRAGGAMLGEFANQKLGITEESAGQTALAGVASVAGDTLPGVGRTIKRGMAHLPGAATALREQAARVIEKIPSSLLPKVKSEVLYKRLAELNPSVKLPQFNAIAKELAASEAKLAEFGLISGDVASAASKIAGPGTTQAVKSEAGKWLGDEFDTIVATELKDVLFSLIQTVRRRIGERIGSLRNSTDPKAVEQLTSYKQLFKRLSNDLEAAEGTGGVAAELLTQANKHAKREFASGEIDDILFQTVGKAREGDKATSTNFAQAFNKLRTMRRSNDLFEQSLPKGELDKIEATLKKMSEIGIKPPPKNVNVGSYIAGGRAGAGLLIGAYTAKALGLDPTMGAITGGAGLDLAARLISKGLQTDKGRAFVVRMAQTPGGFTDAKLAALATFLRGLSAETPEE